MSDTVPPVPYGDFYDPPPTTLTKDPADKNPVVIDFSTSCALMNGDYITAITSVTFTPGNGVAPDLIANGAPSIVASPPSGTAAQAVSQPVADGVVDTVYSVSAYVTTFLGNTLKRSVFVPVNPL